MLTSALAYSEGYMDGLCDRAANPTPTSGLVDVYQSGYERGKQDAKSLPPTTEAVHPPKGWDKV